ncbi:MAG: OmpA family protein [Proteobacteria bacterium]|nr:OmpA family protein [Pseudomonadota bacterium]MBU1736952.1 OmpA family protein [Pseudomonadota bacterium]
MLTLRMLSIVLGLSLLATTLATASEQIDWGQKLVGPVKSSSAYHNESSEYQPYKLLTGKETELEIIGALSSSLYKGTEKNTSFEIYSAYMEYLKENKFQILFKSEKSEGISGLPGKLYGMNPLKSDPNYSNSASLTSGARGDHTYYIAAKQKSKNGDIYTGIFITQGWWNVPNYRVDVAQVKPLQTTVLPADEIEKAIQTEGYVAIYGIYFDTNQASIKKESEASLSEISNYMKKHPADVFYVVGHTDDEGKMDDNMDLSLRRAKSVVKYLQEQLNIPGTQLEAHGAGPLAPVANNHTIDGRALNRRVSLVKKLK